MGGIALLSGPKASPQAQTRLQAARDRSNSEKRRKKGEFHLTQSIASCTLFKHRGAVARIKQQLKLDLEQQLGPSLQREAEPPRAQTLEKARDTRNRERLR